MANLEKLNEVVTYLKDHPEEHKQHVWTCRTGACLAGHATLLNGYQKVYRDPLSVMSDGEAIVINGSVRDGSGREYFVQHLAKEILGLSHTEAILLFAVGNDIDNISEMVKDMGNGEDITQTWGLSGGAHNTRAVRREHDAE